MKELDCGMLGLAGMPVGSAMQGKWRGEGTYWDIHLSKIRLIRTLGQPEPCKGQQNKVSNRNNIILRVNLCVTVLQHSKAPMYV